jgi:hypothetical protein
MTQTTLQFDQPRQEQINAVNAAAERRGFSTADAERFILDHLSNGDAHAEPIIEAARAKGLEAHDARAWGRVFASLSRRGQIVKAGAASRFTGNLTPVWRRV